MKFQDKLEKIIKKNNSLLCVGLDPDLGKIESTHKANPLFNFNKLIVDRTADLVCAYKPNIAFYEAYGLESLGQLKKTINYIKKNYPSIPVILDAKRADIPNTARMYAKSAFDYWGADATTVYPYLGLDSVEPFLDYSDKLTILLLKTSNDNSPMFQDLKVGPDPYYIAMAKKISKWKHKNFGIFVGATYPKELKDLRKIFPDRIFLSAGIGAQAGDIKKAVQAGIDKNGQDIMYNVSRSVIYDKNPRTAAENFRDEINKYRAG